MELIKKEDVIKGVAARWKLQYGYKVYGNTDKDRIYERLLALGDSITKAQADEIIGTSGWTRLRCNECGQDVDAVVSVGDSSNYDSANVCRKCLLKALRLHEFGEE